MVIFLRVLQILRSSTVSSCNNRDEVTVNVGDINELSNTGFDYIHKKYSSSNDKTINSRSLVIPCSSYLEYQALQFTISFLKKMIRNEVFDYESIKDKIGRMEDGLYRNIQQVIVIAHKYEIKGDALRYSRLYISDELKSGGRGELLRVATNIYGLCSNQLEFKEIICGYFNEYYGVDSVGGTRFSIKNTHIDESYLDMLKLLRPKSLIIHSKENSIGKSALESIANAVKYIAKNLESLFIDIRTCMAMSDNLRVSKLKEFKLIFNEFK